MVFVICNLLVQPFASIQQVAEYERMSKDLNRSAYTKRIMEIVGNIRKQKNDIDKVKIYHTHLHTP